MVRPLLVALVLAAARVAVADPGEGAAADPVVAPASSTAEEGPVRRPDATYRQMFRGPFQTSRLFAMPTADTVGAYVLSLSGDGSLLQQTGILTSAGVLAIGFGDLAQLEYRHSAAISITGVNAPLPGIGVQLKVPIPELPNVPAFGIAVRLGVPRDEQFDRTAVEEKVTDFYLVGRWRFEKLRWLTLHGGTRASLAQIKLVGDHAHDAVKKTLWLPTAGYEIAMNPTAKIVGEIALAPQFRWMRGTDQEPTIGYGLLGRLGLRWSVLPSLVIDGSIGYQLEVAHAAPASGLDAVVQWDIRLGAEMFVPWGALACRAAGVFCD